MVFRLSCLVFEPSLYSDLFSFPVPIIQIPGSILYALMYSNHLNTRKVWYSNGRFVWFLNGGLKTGLKKALNVQYSNGPSHMTLPFEYPTLILSGIQVFGIQMVTEFQIHWRLRGQILDDFLAGKFKILSCTDLVSRGIDTSNVSHVVNYDFPSNVSDYIHRVGRVGRIGTSQPQGNEMEKKERQ